MSQKHANYMIIREIAFYRIKELYETCGAIALKEASRRKPIPKNRIEADIEQKVVEIACEQHALGQLPVSNELRKTGIFISPCGVRCVWQRHCLETFPKRLKALETKVAQESH